MYRKRGRQPPAGDLAVAAFAADDAAAERTRPGGIPDDLPDVDDLEIAAAAACGVLEPAWVVQKLLGTEQPIPAADAPPDNGAGSRVNGAGGDLMETGDDGDESDSGGSDSGDDSSNEMQVDGEEADAGGGHVTADLRVTGDDRVEVQLKVAAPCSIRPQASTSMCEGSEANEEASAADSSSSSSTSSSSSDDDSDAGLMTVNEYGEIKQMITGMYEGAADGEDRGPAEHNLADKELGMLPLERLEIDIPVDAPLLPAGSVSSVVEGCVVVAGAPGQATLGEGSALCLADRRPVGRVEDVFGPVTHPFYLLRYSGEGAWPCLDATTGAASVPT